MNTKLAAALMVPVLAAGIGMSKADEAATASYGGYDKERECCSATAFIKAELKEECAVTFEGGNCATCINPKTGSLDSALTPKFKLVTNGCDHKLVLTAKVEDNCGSHKNALAKQSGKDYIVLGNAKVKPTAAAITNCESSSPSSASNKECIAYEVKSVAMSGASTGDLVFDSSKDRYETTSAKPAKAGTTHITITTGTAARANTYSDSTDCAGDYKAELTLTAYSI